jgi:site-specific recombinase XerD
MSGISKIGFRSFLTEQMQQFIAHKRALGRRYDVEEKAVWLLDRYLVEHGVKQLNELTPELINAFLASRPRHRPRSYNHLLGTVRRLFNWLVIQDILPCSPAQAVTPRRTTGERLPFIFDQSTARRLLELATRLPDNARAPMRGHTYRVIFAILYGLGLRVSEVCRLRLDDVDLDRRLLVIRQTKFYKSRLVPFGPRMAMLLEEYRQARLARAGTSATSLAGAPFFFPFTADRTIHPCTVSQTFHALIPHLRVQVAAGCSPPRLHDLRHSFAVGTLLRWYRGGEDAGTRLFKLATFLGHVDPDSTAVYLKITGALLEQANRRFESFAAPALREGVQP